MEFYKSVIEHRGKILVRGVLDGKEYNERLNFKPKLYVLSQEESKWKDLKGRNLKEINFDSIHKAREFKKSYATSNSPIYGLDRYQYQYISDNFPGEVEWNKDHIKIFTIDIETTCEDGFPDVENPQEKLLVITVKNQTNKHIITWGVGDFKTDRTDVTYIKCKTEKHLIMEFMKFWIKNYPDVITGWNCKFFDLPYLVNRIKLLTDEKVIKKLSPWNIVEEQKVEVRGREQTVYTLFGISNLDYLDLYTRYIPQRQESYKLNFIGNVELGTGKDDNPYETFKDWYTKDFQSFVDYNIQDVEIVDGLEDKLGLIELLLTMAYDARVNYLDIFSQIRVWDTYIYNHLKDRGIQIPPKEHHTKDEKYVGAYVKDPIVGMHKWVVSFDLNSLYPHLIMQYNISPEKYVGQDSTGVSVSNMLKKKVDTAFLKEKGITMTPNGARFKTDSQGFLPKMMEDMYNDRKKFKRLELQASQQYENDKTKTELKKTISRYHNIQWSKKIAFNSAFGAIGNQYFRYYDVAQASAITTSGQYVIKWIENKMNDYLTKVIGEEGDYIVASDTDSIYVTLDKLVEKICKDKSKEQIVKILDKICTEKFEPYIDKCYAELADYSNAFQQKMEMAREVIADKGIWVAKKRYMLNVHNSEGVQYAKPKLKIMGIEAIKSSTPEICRTRIKEAITIIMEKDETDLQKFIADFRQEFAGLEPEQVAFPRSCNNLRKYADSSNIFQKSCPIHVKGALIYNHYLREMKLTRKYPEIQEGDKIKFILMKEPNPFKHGVISYITTLPKEFDVHRFIDYDTQFEKTFLDPMRFILEAINWKAEKVASLEDFF